MQKMDKKIHFHECLNRNCYVNEEDFFCLVFDWFKKNYKMDKFVLYFLIIIHYFTSRFKRQKKNGMNKMKSFSYTAASHVMLS